MQRSTNRPGTARAIRLAVGTSVIAALAACGGGGGSNSEDVFLCPAWSPGDSMTYMRTETVSGTTPSSVVL